MTKLSVLNLVPVRQGHSYQETIAEMKRLAQRVEELGYHRYWIGEHHNTKLLPALQRYFSSKKPCLRPKLSV